MHTSQTTLIVFWSTCESGTRIKPLCHMWCQDEAMLLGVWYGSTGNFSCMPNFEARLFPANAPDSKWNIDNLPQSHKWWKIFTKTLFWCFPKQFGMNFFSSDTYVKSLFYQINIGKYDTFVSIAYTVKYEFVYFQTNSFWPVKDPMSFSWGKIYYLGSRLGSWQKIKKNI